MWGSCFVDYRLILLLVVFGILFWHVFFRLRELEAYEKIEKSIATNTKSDYCSRPHAVRGQHHARASVTPGSQSPFSEHQMGSKRTWEDSSLHINVLHANGIKDNTSPIGLTHRATGPVELWKRNM